MVNARSYIWTLGTVVASAAFGVSTAVCAAADRMVFGWFGGYTRANA